MKNSLESIHKDDDELDLVQFVKTIWDKKLIIVFTTVLASSIALAYALFAQQWWTATSIVTKPQYQQLNQVRAQLTNFYSVIGAEYNNDENGAYRNYKLDEMLSSENVIKMYINEYNAFNNKVAFFENFSFFKKEKEALNINDNTSIFNEEWAKRISATRVDGSNTYVLKVQSKTPKLSYELLVEYGHEINKKVRIELLNDISALISQKKLLLTAELNALEAKAAQLLDREKKTTKYSLAIAEGAEIINPMEKMSDSQLFPIELGYKALKEKEKILENVSDLSLFVAEISTVRTNLNLINKIKLDEAIVFRSTKVLKDPGYPTSRDEPRRFLILLLGAFLGFSFGIVIVILNAAFKKNNNN